MKQPFRPLLLLPNKSIQLKHDDQNDYGNPAVCSMKNNSSGLKKKVKMGNDGKITPYEDDSSQYEIILYDKPIMKLFVKSWIKNIATLNEFETGFVLHELAHIKYESFKVNPGTIGYVGNKLFDYLFNLLEDSRIEYRLSIDFPAFSIYFHWLLLAVKQNIKFNNAIPNSKISDMQERIKNYLDILFKMVRFGIVEEGEDIKFVNYCLPFVLSAKRGDVINCMNCARYIYHYIMEKLDDQEAETAANDVRFDEMKPITEGEADELDQMDTVMKQFSKNKEMKAAADTAAYNHNDIQIEENETGFYRKTVNENIDIIQKIRNVFKKFFQTASWHSVYEGDLDLKRQQEAYLNSITGEEGQDYVGMKLKDPSLDIAILRDISGSTNWVKDEYAKAMVCVLAALDDLSGIRTTQIDFSDNHRVNKHFKESVKESRIEPKAEGGTSISSAILELQSMNWSGRNKMVFIITDGDITDLPTAKVFMNELVKEKSEMKFYMINVGNNGYRTNVNVTCSLDELPETISKMILEGMGIYGKK